MIEYVDLTVFVRPSVCDRTLYNKTVTEAVLVNTTSKTLEVKVGTPIIDIEVTE